MAFGFGSSEKYGCDRQAFAEGRFVGSRARRCESRLRPDVVRYGNLVRGRSGTAGPEVDALEGGRRRDFALGRERKEGQVLDVGGPVRAKIYALFSTGL